MFAAKKWSLLVIVVALIVIIGSFVTFYSGWVNPPAEVATVRVGWLTGDLHHLAYFVAKTKVISDEGSFFEKRKLNIADANPIGYPNGPAMMDAFAVGEVDIGLLGTAPAIIKHLNSAVNTTIVGQVNSIGSALIVRHPVTSMIDIKGKTVATPGPGTIQHFMFLRLAEKEGLGIGNFTLTKLAPKDMRVAMEAGAIDAFIAWEPYCADAVVNDIGVIYKNSSDIWPNHICCVVVVDKMFAAEHPDVLNNFLKAHIEATNWINEAKVAGHGSANHDLLMDIAANFTGRKPEVIEAALSNINYDFELDDEFLGIFMEFTNKLFEYGIVPYDTMESWGYTNVYDFAQKYVDESYLAKAKQI